MKYHSVKFDEIFPTKWSFIIFIAYMALFVNQGILVKASQSNGNSYSYDVISVILCSELLKLLFCVGFYYKENSSLKALFSEFKDGIRVGYLYMIPAFLYCLYNNLSFINLSNYDPTTYFILLQFRNVVTGLLYQFIFKKKLVAMQWVSLFILTFGCIVKEFGRFDPWNNSENNEKNLSSLMHNLFLIIIQIFCSCFAGVYNEYLLKDAGASVPILIQNMFMYCDSIICNLFLLLFTNSKFDFSFLSRPIILVILVNGALAGITTSFFLKSLNSILKTFAATIEIFFTAIICYFVFGTSIDIFTGISMILIFIAIFIYSRKPISNTNFSADEKKSHGIVPVCPNNEIDDMKILIIKSPV